MVYTDYCGERNGDSHNGAEARKEADKYELEPAILGVP